MKTKVMFRIFHGEVIALFPDLPAAVGESDCASYGHIGQHSAADYRLVMRKSRPATHDEYRELYAELRRIGYKLQIVKRGTAADLAKRRTQFAN